MPRTLLCIPDSQKKRNRPFSSSYSMATHPEHRPERCVHCVHVANDECGSWTSVPRTRQKASWLQRRLPRFRLTLTPISLPISHSHPKITYLVNYNETMLLWCGAMPICVAKQWVWEFEFSGITWSQIKWIHQLEAVWSGWQYLRPCICRQRSPRRS